MDIWCDIATKATACNAQPAILGLASVRQSCVAARKHRCAVCSRARRAPFWQPPEPQEDLHKYIMKGFRKKAVGSNKWIEDHREVWAIHGLAWVPPVTHEPFVGCLLYTSDAADDM
eukprot:15238612-Alexandrium_andersonii.AAC.1